MPRHSLTRILIAVAVAAALGACAADSAAPVIPADVDSIVAAAADAMGTIDTVRFRILRDGATVYIDTEGILAFEAAEGRFAAPSSADALVTVKALGLTTRVGAVAIDGAIYLTNPVTGGWEEAPADFTFDPATLFDPETGWRPLFESGLSDAELVATIENDGRSQYHIRGLGEAARVAVITGGLVTEEALLDLWIDAVDGVVVRASFETTTPAGVTGWELELFGYGEEVEVTPPDLTG